MRHTLQRCKRRAVHLNALFSVFLSSLDSTSISKRMFSYAIAVLVTIGIAFSTWLTLLDKQFESKKNILDLMYIQGKNTMSDEEFTRGALKNTWQYCLTISDLNQQKNCRLTLYKAKELYGLSNAIAFYIALAYLIFSFFISTAIYSVYKRFYPLSSTKIYYILFFSFVFLFFFIEIMLILISL